MKIHVYCSKCPKDDFDNFISIKLIPQDFMVRTKCKRDHNVLIHLSNPLYSILFDKCIIAYYEENYRSSIFEAASALERFYEHAIRIFIIQHKDIGDFEKIKLFNEAWKTIKNMSERQIGAFVMLFHKLTGKTPILLNDKMVALRNNTIHKGYLPFKDEAFIFLGNVYDIIQTNRSIVRPYDEEAFWLLDQRVDFENQRNPKDVDDKEWTIVGYSGPHFFNSAFGSDFNSSLEKYYETYLKI